MTTPAQNYLYSYNSNARYVARYLSNGAVYTQGTQGSFPKRQGHTRPVSTNNPVRSDKTRKPNGWRHDWFHSSGGFGRTSLDLDVGSPWAVNWAWNGAVIPGNCPEGRNGASQRGLDAGLRAVTNARLGALANYTEDWKQLSAAAAEARKTLGLASDFTRKVARETDKLTDFTEDLKRKDSVKRNWRKYGPNWKALAGRYLAWKYAVTPIAGDLENAFDHMLTLPDLGLGMRMVLSKRFDYNEPCETGNLQLLIGGGAHTVHCRGRRFVYGKVSYVYDLPAWFLETSGPPLAPFSTAWELTRLSFVLDWFLPVGNWIGAMEAAQIAPHYREGSETFVVKEIYDMSQLDLSKTWFGVSARNPSATVSGRIELGTMIRTVRPTHPFAWENGIARKPFPKLQLATQGLALMTQAITRHMSVLSSR